MTYILQETSKSRCPVCNNPVDLLTDDFEGQLDENPPMFYICWPCQKVFQVGTGEIRREGA